MTLDDLRSMGVNVDEALKRCLDNEKFYFKMIDKCLNDDNFARLGQALDDGDMDQAFEYAHAIKGVVSNLALTPLQEKISELTDLLRAHAQTDYNDLYASLIKLKEEMLRL